MGIDGWILLRRLHRAAKKLKLLILSFNIGHRWRLASILGSHNSVKRLSFNDRQGLQEFSDGVDGDGRENSESSRVSPKTGGGAIERTRSSFSTTDEDVDSKADMFIANFYKQLQMERQVSLELRYLRGYSLESNRSID
ncbi:hypothetical protein Sjap_010642 [Stephania japonica]|uniref:Uncharacterized protein n=1 Tax=Stephania japonica TaxID=461633 RepID=A0AAP0JBL5_9MAGN